MCGHFTQLVKGRGMASHRYWLWVFVLCCPMLTRVTVGLQGNLDSPQGIQAWLLEWGDPGHRHPCLSLRFMEGARQRAAARFACPVLPTQRQRRSQAQCRTQCHGACVSGKAWAVGHQGCSRGVVAAHRAGTARGGRPHEGRRRRQMGHRRELGTMP